MTPTAAASSNGDLPFVIEPSDVNFPLASFTKPVPGQAQITLASPATGTANVTTGAISFTASFAADITIPGLGSCTVTTGPTTFSTSGTSVYSGQAYPVTSTPGAGFLTGPGAISGGWTAPASDSGSACAILGSAVTGGGGLWISDNLATPSVTLASAPAKTSVKAGKSVTITATVKDAAGSLSATGVSVCVVPPKALALHGSKCQTIATVAGGASKSVRFTFKASSKAKGNETVKVSATGAASTTISTIKIEAVKAPKKKKK